MAEFDPDKPAIVREVVDGDSAHRGWMIFCPGCQCGHMFDSRWDFNMDLEKPTFTGSMLVNGSDPNSRCHSYVRDGNIEFLSDCFHDLKGKTVPLEKF